jgi:peptide/nickel transport system permease protein
VSSTIDLGSGVLPVAAAEVQTATRARLLRALARDRTARIGLVIVVVFVLGALLAPVLATRDPNAQDVLNKFASPSRKFLFGTDHLGRDQWARIVWGARVSIGTAVIAALAIAFVGIALGTLAGYCGGLADALVSRVVEVLLSFPGFLLSLAVTGILGPGLRNLLIVMVFVSWAGYARLVRGLVVAERAKPYLESARSTGVGNLRIVCRHLLPNIGAPVIVLTTLDMGGILLGLAGLSFLGLGVQPPTAEWGAMLSEAKTYLGAAPQTMLYPGAAIFLMVLGFNLLGDGLRDVLDPRTRLTSTRVRRLGRRRPDRLRGTRNRGGPNV